MNWDHIRAFQAVAEHGSFSAAARALQLSQPTIGRHIAAMETALGVSLFTPIPTGMALTEAGIALLPRAETMAEAAAALALTAAGKQADLKGTVRITCSEMFGSDVLPTLLRPILNDLPEVALDLVPSDKTENLLLREADIAVRMVAPTQLDLIARKLGEMPLGFYVHPDLVAGPPPEGPAALQAFDLIGFDRSDLILKGLNARGIPAKREMFRLRVDHPQSYIALITAGLGMGLVARPFAQKAGLLEIQTGITLPRLPVYLVSHSALRTAPLIRHVFDRLTDGLSNWLTDA